MNPRNGKKTLVFLKSMCFVAIFIILFLCLFFFVRCSAKNRVSLQDVRKKDVYKIAIVTDLSGINDQSFNQSAWEGLKELKNELGDKIDISYTEPKQSSDYNLILDRLSDKDYDLIYGISFSLADSVKETALLNLDKNYILVDSSFGEETPNNVACVTFCSQESAFLVGYIAGKKTLNNKVGFVGGQRSEIIEQFEYGFKAGVKFAGKELGKNIEIVTQYAESFSDVAKGKAIGSKMYSGGCDIIFQAAGGTGYGVIESAKENGKLVIGVDRDQSDIAPGNVLTSALKNVNKAVKLVSEKMIKGEDILGKTITFGSKEGCVGIPEDPTIMGEKLYKEALSLFSCIENGCISINGRILIIPVSKAQYEKFLEHLNDI